MSTRPRRILLVVASPDCGRVEPDALTDPRDASSYSKDDALSLAYLKRPEFTAQLEKTPSGRSSPACPRPASGSCACPAASASRSARRGSRSPSAWPRCTRASGPEALLILEIKVPRLPHEAAPAALARALLALWVLWAVLGYKPPAEPRPRSR